MVIPYLNCFELFLFGKIEIWITYCINYALCGSVLAKLLQKLSGILDF